MSSAALAWRASMQIGRETLRAERVIEPHRQWPGFEDHAFGRGRMLAQQIANTSRIGRALAAPDPLAIPSNGNGRLFHRHVEADIFVHGCSPSDAWARLPVVSPYFHQIGEQPPASIA